jgi:hypothetical protein
MLGAGASLHPCMLGLRDANSAKEETSKRLSGRGNGHYHSLP